MDQQYLPSVGSVVGKLAKKKTVNIPLLYCFDMGTISIWARYRNGVVFMLFPYNEASGIFLYAVNTNGLWENSHL
jgi:hypothetical protein